MTGFKTAARRDDEGMTKSLRGRTRGEKLLSVMVFFAERKHILRFAPAPYCFFFAKDDGGLVYQLQLRASKPLGHQTAIRCTHSGSQGCFLSEQHDGWVPFLHSNVVKTQSRTPAQPARPADRPTTHSLLLWFFSKAVTNSSHSTARLTVSRQGA